MLSAVRQTTLDTREDGSFFFAGQVFNTHAGTVDYNQCRLEKGVVRLEKQSKYDFVLNQNGLNCVPMDYEQ